MDDRRGDWQQGVDENLASLNAIIRVLQRDQKDVLKRQSEQDRLLRGDPDRDTSGMIGRMEWIEHEVRKANAVLFVDSTGTKGIVHDVDMLMDRKKDKTEERKLKWSFLTAIAVAIISSTALVLTNLDKILKFFPKEKPDQLSQMIEKSKHRKGKPIVRYRIITPAKQDSDTPEEESQNQ